MKANIYQLELYELGRDDPVQGQGAGRGSGHHQAPTDLMKAFAYIREHMGWKGEAAYMVIWSINEFFHNQRTWKNTICGGSPRIKIEEADETTIIQLDSAYDNDKGNAALEFPTIDLSTIDVSGFPVGQRNKWR